MKYKVYSGFLEWYVTVDAPNEHLALVYGKPAMLERLVEDNDMWAVPVKAESPSSGP